MVEPEIVESVQEYLRKLRDTGLSVSFGVIFGSYADGCANQLSDIDLLVVSDEFDHSLSRKHINTLWRVAARTDSRIEPIPCGKLQWENDTSNAIIEIARTKGQEITAA